MSSLRALWNIASADEPNAAWPNRRWRNLLGEFVDLLNEHYGDFLRASLVDGSAPDVFYVRLWPKGQRNSSFTILTIHATDTKARILGKDTLEFLDDDGLAKHLIKLKNSRLFQNSLNELKTIAHQPVEGVLRVGASWKAAVLADIKVIVSPEEQRRFAEASEADVPLKIERLHVTQTGSTTYERGAYPSSTNPPHWLVAGGYVLSIEDHGADTEERIWLSGSPIPATKLDKRG